MREKFEEYLIDFASKTTYLQSLDYLNTTIFKGKLYISSEKELIEYFSDSHYILTDNEYSHVRKYLNFREYLKLSSGLDKYAKTYKGLGKNQKTDKKTIAIIRTYF